MKLAKRIKWSIVLIIFSFTAGFVGCGKKSRTNRNDLLRNQRNNTDYWQNNPGSTQNCPTCPVLTNIVAEAIGSSGTGGSLAVEFGVALYTTNNYAQGSYPGSLSGAQVGVEGYMQVDRDTNGMCPMMTGLYDIFTVQPGTVAYDGNIEGLVMEARSRVNGEVVTIQWGWSGWNMASPQRASTVDGRTYPNFLIGQMYIQSIQGPQINCSPMDYTGYTIGGNF